MEQNGARDPQEERDGGVAGPHIEINFETTGPTSGPNEAYSQDLAEQSGLPLDIDFHALFDENCVISAVELALFSPTVLKQDG